MRFSILTIGNFCFFFARPSVGLPDSRSPTPQSAKTLTPDARRDARVNRFAFTVDRLPNRNQFGIRMTNRGGRPLMNPTVKIWLPPGVTQVGLGGDFIMRRNATLTGVPEEGA